MYTLFGAIVRVAFWGILSLSIWSIAHDWSMLMASGGLYAALGQFFAVFFTLTLLVMLICLGMGLVCLPLLIYYAVATPEVREEHSIGGWAVRLANPPWKICWWTAWWLRRLWRMF